MSDDKRFAWSRIIVLIIQAVIFQVIFINCDKNLKIAGLIISVILYILSFSTTRLSEKLIEIGDNREKGSKFYMVVSTVFIGIFCLLAVLHRCFTEPESDIGIMLPYANAIRRGNFLLYATIVELPYLQMLIVLMMRKLNFINNSRKEK